MCEDIERIIREWLNESKLQEDVMYDIDCDTRIITIYTTRPGWLIGVGGHLVNKYIEKTREAWSRFENFHFKEIWGYVARTEVK